MKFFKLICTAAILSILSVSTIKAQNWQKFLMKVEFKDSIKVDKAIIFPNGTKQSVATDTAYVVGGHGAGIDYRVAVDSIVEDNSFAKIYNGGDTLTTYIPYSSRINIDDYVEMKEDSMPSLENGRAGTYASGYDLIQGIKLRDGILEAYQRLDTTIKAFGPIGANPTIASSTYAMIDGTAIFIAIDIKVNTHIKGVSFIITTAGAYTPDNTNGIALYKINGSNKELVASYTSSADPNMWEQANGIYSVTFASPYDAIPGIYYVALLNNRSDGTAPSIAAVPAGSIYTAAFASFPNNLELVGTKAITSFATPIASNSIDPNGARPLISIW
jgi:hypothetical protein